jgi:hypothetical protein
VNWEAVGAICEIVAALGVIISLVYLANQVRQNTRIARAQTRQALADGAQALSSDWIEVDGAALLMRRHMEGERLDPPDALRLQARAYRDFRFFENAYYQYTEGLLTSEEWDGFRTNLEALFGIPMYREFWEVQRPIYSPAFGREIESIAQKPVPDLASKQQEQVSTSDD